MLCDIIYYRLVYNFRKERIFCNIMKLAIVINGGGGAGKDTLCDFAAKKFKTVNVSSIDPIKKIAGENGWKGVTLRKYSLIDMSP